jgi:uncharacterized protein (TIGR03086 family)
MALGDSPAERHRHISRTFTDRVLGVRSWDAPSPVAGWTARDVVRHLIDWTTTFVASGTGIELPRGPSVDDDPVTAWRIHSDGVQALLDDPATARRELTHPRIGRPSLESALDRFYNSDVFMHTWDLARATDQDDWLDPDYCAEILAELERVDERILRNPDVFGPRVEVPADADAQTRLIGFIGRDPSWRPS